MGFVGRASRSLALHEFALAVVDHVLDDFGRPVGELAVFCDELPVGVSIKDLMSTQVFFSKTEGRFNANAVGGYSNFHSDSTGEAAK